MGEPARCCAADVAALDRRRMNGSQTRPLRNGTRNPREKRRLATVKRYIKALAVRWGRSENAVREHLRGRLMVARERCPEGRCFTARDLACQPVANSGRRIIRAMCPLKNSLRTGDLEAYRAACKRRTDR